MTIGENVKYNTDTIVDSGGIGLTLYAENLGIGGGISEETTANEVDHGGGGGGGGGRGEGVESSSIDVKRLSPVPPTFSSSSSPITMGTRFVVEEAKIAPTPPVRVNNRPKKRFDVSPVVENPSASFPDPQDSVNSETPGLFAAAGDDDLNFDGEVKNSDTVSRVIGTRKK